MGQTEVGLRRGVVTQSVGTSGESTVTCDVTSDAAR